MTTPAATAPADPSAGGSISSSLLARAQARSPEAWVRLVRLYYPLVQAWGRRAGLQPEDAADLAQEVFRAVAGGVERFRRDGRSFRGWLWGITTRQLLAFRRRRDRQPVGAGGTTAQDRLADLAAAGSESASRPDAPGDRTDLLRRALAELRGEVEDRSWQAFWRTAVEGQTAAEAGAALGLSANAVYLAKARLLRRLREEYGELLA